MSAQNLKYNAYSLQDISVAASQRLTSNILYNQLAEKTINIQSDSIRDGWSLLDVKYTNKIIAVNGWLISDTAANLKTLIDTFKGSLRPNDKNLDIETYGGSGVYTRWKATVRNIQIPEEHWQISQKPFSVEFLCKPFATATSTTTINLNSGGNITTTPYNEDITISGSYNPKPVITITVVAETDLTAIKFENTVTQDWIQVARSFTAAEVLVIDCDAETVKVDGVAVDFTGIFPEFNPSTNSIKITSTDSGAFQITCSIVYYLTYL